MLSLIPFTLAGSAVTVGAVLATNRKSTSAALIAALQGQETCSPWRRVTQRALHELDTLRAELNTFVGDLARGEAVARPARSAPAPTAERNLLVDNVRTALQTVDDQYQQFMHRHFDRLFGADRDQQLHEISAAGGGLLLTPYERKLNHNIAISALITSITWIAANHPVLVVLTCFPATLYISLFMLQRAYHCIFVERKFKMPVMATFNMLATWAGGFYFADGVSSLLYFLSEKLIAISEDRSMRKMVNIFGQQPRSVWAVIAGVEVEIPFEQVEVGTTIVIGAGQMIAVDGLICAGYASIDQHRLTGEARPVEKQVGDRVMAATIVLAGKIYVQVEKTGKETAAAQIGEILNTTASYQMAIESRALQVANASLKPTLLVAGLAWLVQSFEGAIAITNAAFGFNVKFTGPIAMLNYLNLAARRGLLVKDGRSLELLRDVDTVIFDKTGTLTIEEPHLAQIHLFNGLDQATLLAYAAAVEARQNHPIAHAIVTAAKEQGLCLPAIRDASYELGYGLKAWVEGRLIRIGSDRFMALEEVSLPSAVADLQAKAHGQGNSLVMVALDDELAGVIELAPTIRPEAQQVITDLHKRGKQVYIISGDQEQPTHNLAEKLGIDHYFANTLPEDKAGHVERLQAEGRIVCFVGDGINDSIALKKAQVSVSLRGATSIATDTAQIVMMDTTLNQLPELFQLADHFATTTKTGFVVAMIPGCLIVGGVFLANMGILGSLAIYNVGLVMGVGVAMLPLWQHRIP